MDREPSSSFSFLAPHGPLYLRLAAVAEGALTLDPSLTLLKLRQLNEAFARHAAARAGLLRREVEALVEKQHGPGYLKNQHAKAELARIDRELKRLKTQVAALENRRSELVASWPGGKR